jgi:hypothetical protein
MKDKLIISVGLTLALIVFAVTLYFRSGAFR